MAPAPVCHGGFWSQSMKCTSWLSLAKATSHGMRRTFLQNARRRRFSVFLLLLSRRLTVRQVTPYAFRQRCSQQ
eukprot:3318399-Alexandrium_andersonii.AAC.1